MKYILSLFILLASITAFAQGQEDDKGTFAIAWENDYLVGEDDGYTNGVRFSWLSPETTVPEWLKSFSNHLPFFAREGKERYSIAVGQSMFAPEDISQSGLIVDDRPYAGWLYGSVGLISDTGSRLDNLMLTIGLVGPDALGEQVQDAVHHMIGDTDPQGWDNQLHNEPGIVLSYERKDRSLYEFTPFGMGADITPYAGVSLGNVFTHASIGATTRIGRDLPSDYGPPRIRPSMPGSDYFVPTKDLGWYFFAGAEGRAVGRNIFLDGNTFQESHSVDKKYFIGELQAGVAVTYGNTRLAYTHVLRTKEFRQQDDAEAFGAVTLSFRF